MGPTDLQGLQAAGGGQAKEDLVALRPCAASWASVNVTFSRAKGARRALTGMKGRVAIYEVMPVTEPLVT